MTTRAARVLAALAALTLPPSLTGCGLLGDEGGAGSDGVRVAAGFYALAYVAERVGGDHVDVSTLTQPGQDPHDVELSVARTAEVAEADLVLHQSGFQPVVDDAVDSDVETSFDLELRPGTQSGTEQVLRGRGVPGLRGGRGDLVVNVLVETPTRLDARQEELLLELSALRGEQQPTGQVRPSGRSVFGRLRDAFNH